MGASWYDSISISIKRSPYVTSLDRYLNTVRCQRDVISSMKAETPVIRSTAHNLLLRTMEYLVLLLLLAGPKFYFVELCQSISINRIIKKYVFWLILFKNTYAYSFMRIEIPCVCHFYMYHSDKISVHRDAPVNRYTPKQKLYQQRHIGTALAFLWDVYLQKLIDVSGQNCSNSIANTLELAAQLALIIYKKMKSYPMPAQFANAWKHGQH